MKEDLVWQVRLSLVPHIGPVHAKLLSETYGSAQDIFRASLRELTALEGIGAVRAQSIRSFRDDGTATAEVAFMEQYRITPLFLTDPRYPRRLLHCYDPPTLLYFRGTADLNTQKVIAVIGTRNNTSYGRNATETLLRDLAGEDILVVSGLAFGIDAVAHQAALDLGLATVGVMAHGFGTLYPPQHATLAKEMMRGNGGLLTEYRHDAVPDRHQFPIRNRVVAGMCDAVVVVETDRKGGSMITAELANGYHRDVFALPGRISDKKSAGCNHLVRSNKATLLTDAAQLLDMMGWKKPDNSGNQRERQRSLFTDLSQDEKTLLGLLEEKEMMHIDELNHKSHMSGSQVATAILHLELKNIISCLPGKMYRLN